MAEDETWKPPVEAPKYTAEQWQQRSIDQAALRANRKRWLWNAGVLIVGVAGYAVWTLHSEWFKNTSRGASDAPTLRTPDDLDFGTMWCSEIDDVCTSSASRCEQHTAGKCRERDDYVCAAYDAGTGPDIACYVSLGTCLARRDEAIAKGHPVGECKLGRRHGP